MKVRIQGSSIRWPQQCACCLAASTHTIPASRTKKLHLGIATHERSLQIDVPYCGSCVQHVEWAEAGGKPRVYLRAVVTFMVAAFLGTIVTMLLLSVVPTLMIEIAPKYGSLKGAPPLAWAILMPLASCAMPIVVAVMLARRALRGAPSAPLGSEHAAPGHAIQVLDFDGEGMTLVASNVEFGTRLAAANT